MEVSEKNFWWEKRQVTLRGWEKKRQQEKILWGNSVRVSEMSELFFRKTFY